MSYQNLRNLRIALNLARHYDRAGQYKEADFLEACIAAYNPTRTAQADESFFGKVGNAVSNMGYATQNWGANAFLGGGQNAQRVVDQIDYSIQQMQSNAFLRDQNQKQALLAALQQARQIAYSLTSNFSDQQQQQQQQKESELASKLLTPKLSSKMGTTRTADNRSLPVAQNDIQNLINFARQAYGNRDQQQVAQLLTALQTAKSVLTGYGYTPANNSYSQPYSGTAQQATPLDPTHLNAQQRQFFEKYMQIGIARGRDAMMQEMNANPYHTAPFKNMVTQFWDRTLGPQVEMREKTMQSAPKAAYSARKNKEA